MAGEALNLWLVSAEDTTAWLCGSVCGWERYAVYAVKIIINFLILLFLKIVMYRVPRTQVFVLKARCLIIF